MATRRANAGILIMRGGRVALLARALRLHSCDERKALSLPLGDRTGARLVTERRNRATRRRHREEQHHDVLREALIATRRIRWEARRRNPAVASGSRTRRPRATRSTPRR